MNDETRKPRVHVTAGVIRRDGQILITRRPKGIHLSGFWEFPGGKQEPGEDLIECLVREIKEELDIDIKIQKALLTAHHKYDTKEVTIHFFDCTILKGDPNPLEGQEMRWVTPGDLLNYTFPPPDRKMIDFLVSREI
ncbi:MAG: (deoxy)nucleoside triphosphate pyrophosphohydrolase [Deltaproteobacteria bacterium]|nr:(deoxy)nucleoside triphosphate pyrophosphohydrolase [Deltaproteobacteria bacterium]